jgi:hypothetical protein
MYSVGQLVIIFLKINKIYICKNVVCRKVGGEGSDGIVCTMSRSEYHQSLLRGNKIMKHFLFK